MSDQHPPEAVSKLVEPYSTVYAVPRRCSCGTEWLGCSFQPLAETELLPRNGRCAKCLEADERYMEMLQGRRPTEVVPEAIELAPPREPGE